MRIIAGEFRGRRIDTPPNDRTRPITDRVKEALFSALGARFQTLAALPPCDVLDLFAGGGSLGLESLSRGARSCLFVERDRQALQTLRGNIDRLGLRDRSRLAGADAWTLTLSPHAGPFGLVFVDPPYRDSRDAGRIRALLQRLGGWMAPGAIAILRHEGDLSRDALAAGLAHVDSRAYGRMRLELLQAVDVASIPHSAGTAEQS